MARKPPAHKKMMKKHPHKDPPKGSKAYKKHEKLEKRLADKEM